MSGLPVQRIMQLVLSLEMKGVIKQIGNQYYAIVL